ncbi:MAG: hypothetical protein ACI85K_002210 [Hyphomicrobiaceae bacterium]|jgi:hypothetical protein
MQPSDSSHQGGFALIVLLSVVGVSSLGVLLAVQALVPSLRERQAVTDYHLDTAAAAAADAYRRNGSFPTDLASLATAGGVTDAGHWQRDPLGSGQELDYQIVATGVRVRSRGVDGQLGTADDNQRLVSTDTQMRLRQRLRLRMLRAVLLRSPYRWDSLMTPAEQLQMRDAMRDYAMAKRDWLTATAGERTLLAAVMAGAADTVNALGTSYGMLSLPTSLTGAGGLMSQLGMSDARAVDGSGAALQHDTVLGWIAIGADGTGGTDDDM